MSYPVSTTTRTPSRPVPFVVAVIGALALSACQSGVTEPESPELQAAKGGRNGPAQAQIVFQSSAPGSYNDLYVMNPDGTGVAQMTFTPSHQESFPRWSPDRTRVAYLRWDGTPVGQVCVAAVNSPQIPPTCLSIQVNGLNASSFGWAPDGASLLATIAGEVFRLTPPTTGLWYVEPVLQGGQAIHGNWIDISSAGQLALSSGTTVDVGTVAGVATVFQLPAGHSDISGLAWSPDGSKLAFHMKDGSGRAQVFVVNADGTGLRQMTAYSAPFAALYPTWSPDGRKLAFTRHNASAFTQDIMRVGLSGNGLTALTSVSSGTASAVPDWSN